MDAFRDRYRKAFERHFGNEQDPLVGEARFTAASLDRAQMMRDTVARASRWAAISLLVRYHDRQEYDLNLDERTRLVHICVDLLHAGTTLKLRFWHDLPT